MATYDKVPQFSDRGFTGRNCYVRKEVPKDVACASCLLCCAGCPGLALILPVLARRPTGVECEVVGSEAPKSNTIGRSPPLVGCVANGEYV
jgi:hypothetical protein